MGLHWPIEECVCFPGFDTGTCVITFCATGSDAPLLEILNFEKSVFPEVVLLSLVMTTSIFWTFSRIWYLGQGLPADVIW
jgi:hypothetical protein